MNWFVLVADAALIAYLFHRTPPGQRLRLAAWLVSLLAGIVFAYLVFSVSEYLL